MSESLNIKYQTIANEIIKVKSYDELLKLNNDLMELHGDIIKEIRTNQNNKELSNLQLLNDKITSRINMNQYHLTHMKKIKEQKEFDSPETIVVPIMDGGSNEKNNGDISIMKKDKSYLVLFHAEWCSHCKRLMPTWDAFAAKNKHNKSIGFKKISCVEHPDVCDAFANGYPTIILFSDGKKHVYPGNRQRNEEEFKKFIAKKINLSI